MDTVLGDFARCCGVGGGCALNPESSPSDFSVPPPSRTGLLSLECSEVKAGQIGHGIGKCESSSESDKKYCLIEKKYI